MMRENWMISNFAQIAMMSYWRAKSDYEKLKKLSRDDEKWVSFADSVTNNGIICITFSAIELEAFFNDYAADKLGDDFYYKTVSRISPPSKLKFISKIILQHEMNEKDPLYKCVSELFRQRNRLAHSESKKVDIIGMTEEEAAGRNDDFSQEEVDKLLNGIRDDDLSELNGYVQNSLKALSVIKEVALFFNEYSERNNFLNILLYSNVCDGESPENQDHMVEVQNDLKIPPLWRE